MRISDWSSDVCSSDLEDAHGSCLRSGDESRRDRRRCRELEFAANSRSETIRLDQLANRCPVVALADMILPPLNLAKAELAVGRSEERRVGKECVSTCGFRGAR